MARLDSYTSASLLPWCSSYWLRHMARASHAQHCGLSLRRDLGNRPEGSCRLLTQDACLLIGLLASTLQGPVEEERRGKEAQRGRQTRGGLEARAQDGDAAEHRLLRPRPGEPR
ncbi:unnamed protein product [Prorocentrum cordatum]|uniref:Uncharacterized protein n=1 Tax=Prorocentrum cordatum TaxID=2364126 RepID=A0ABN9VNX4_9DINO|nr:unnamed protein product [Polarella glacialis]